MMTPARQREIKNAALEAYAKLLKTGDSVCLDDHDFHYFIACVLSHISLDFQTAMLNDAMEAEDEA